MDVSQMNGKEEMLHLFICLTNVYLNIHHIPDMRLERGSSKPSLPLGKAHCLAGKTGGDM